MAKAKKHPPHTPDPLVKAAEAMPKDKRARQYYKHGHGGSAHTWTSEDTAAMVRGCKYVQKLHE